MSRRSGSPACRGLCTLVSATMVAGIWPAPAAASLPAGLHAIEQTNAERHSAPAEVTPELAEKNREEVHREIDPMMEDDRRAAAEKLDEAARAWGDPVLFLDAADADLAEARASKDPVVAASAIERARIALDILHLHRDEDVDQDFRLVTAGTLRKFIRRGEELVAAGEALIVEIEAEPAPAPVVEEPTVKSKAKAKSKRGGATAKPTTMVIAGATLVGLGVAGLGVGAAGLGLGVAAQRRADDRSVYGTEYDDVADRGARANSIAIAGLVVGGGLSAAGVALLVVGLKRKRAEGTDARNAVRVSPVFDAAGSGVSVSGRF